MPRHDLQDSANEIAHQIAQILEPLVRAGFPIAPEKFFAVWWQKEQRRDERLRYQHF